MMISLVTAGSPAQQIEIAPSLVGAHSSRAIQLLVPPKGRDKFIFDVYHADRDSAMARGSWTRKVDMTGVAWDRIEAGTLITPQHILVMRHTGRPMDVPIRFHNSKGRMVERTLVEHSHVDPGPEGRGPVDLVMFKLDQPVPEDIHVYRVLPPLESWRTTLRDAQVFYTDQERKLMVTKILGFVGVNVRFTRNFDMDEFYQEPVVGGDSGNPSFLFVNGEPVLLELHSGGGWGAGPFLSHPEVFRLVDEALLKMGGKYQLSTIPLKGIPARPSLR